MGSSKKNNTLAQHAKIISLREQQESVRDSVQEIESSQDEEDLFEHYKFITDKGQSMMRLDKYLTQRITETSRNRIQMAIEAGYVRVNGKVAKSNYKIKPLDDISFVFPYEKRTRDICPQKIPLDIVYEDDDVIVVNKPAGLVVHPGHGHFDGTLLNALAYHFTYELGNPPDIPPEKIAIEDVKQGILVHRIDKDTSGLLLIAKTDEAQIKLAKQFYEHSTKREYVAIVWGNIEEDEGTIDANIARSESDRMKFAVPKDPTKGRHAVTHYKVLRRFGYVTVVECHLETGRTHQIRVHLKHIGHPLFSDERYGGDKILSGTIFTKYRQFIENCFEILPRQALHARTLGFVHPITGKETFFTSELPDDMKALIKKMEDYTRR